MLATARLAHHQITKHTSVLLAESCCQPHQYLTTHYVRALRWLLLCFDLPSEFSSGIVLVLLTLVPGVVLGADIRLLRYMHSRQSNISLRVAAASVTSRQRNTTHARRHAWSIVPPSRVNPRTRKKPRCGGPNGGNHPRLIRISGFFLFCRKIHWRRSIRKRPRSSPGGIDRHATRRWLDCTAIGANWNWRRNGARQIMIWCAKREGSSKVCTFVQSKSTKVVSSAPTPPWADVSVPRRQ
jgi:hypothetical protein